MKQIEIYNIQYEVNDEGWIPCPCFYTSAEDAVKEMRRIVAQKIMSDRKNTKFFKVWLDTPTWHTANKAESQTINFKLNKDFYEYRVFAHKLKFSQQ